MTRLALTLVLFTGLFASYFIMRAGWIPALSRLSSEMHYDGNFGFHSRRNSSPLDAPRSRSSFSFARKICSAGARLEKRGTPIAADA